MGLADCLVDAETSGEGNRADQGSGQEKKGNKEHLVGLGRQPGAVKDTARRKGVQNQECRMQDAGRKCGRKGDRTSAAEKKEEGERTSKHGQKGKMKREQSHKTTKKKQTGRY